ncbi:MAG: hypothetical protein NUW08_02125 [Candidatus Uhrbacteria bacterium]|nr:hypothetical protein [Candidatus Uhrbacteria bacterium]
MPDATQAREVGRAAPLDRAGVVAALERVHVPIGIALLTRERTVHVRSRVGLARHLYAAVGLV